MALHTGGPATWRKTPLIESTRLSNEAGCRVFLKLENLQPGGSFKSRGIGNYMSLAQARLSNSSPTPSSPSDSPRPIHFYSSSGGNAGIACVTAARTLNQPSTVVVPLSTSQFMIDKILSAGASEVIHQGTTWFDADMYLRTVVIPLAEKNGIHAVYVPPFDHPEIWSGHATMIPEIADQFSELGIGREPDLIVCSVGGGGLFNGIHQGVSRQKNWDKTRILAVETIGADSLCTSLDNKRLTTLPGITSLATTLGAVTVSQRTYDLASSGVESGKVKYARYSDAEAAMGVWKFAEYERILVELSCGVTIAPCFGKRLEKVLGRKVEKEEVVVLIVCGGGYTSPELVEKWKTMFEDDKSLKAEEERKQWR